MTELLSVIALIGTGLRGWVENWGLTLTLFISLAVLIIVFFIFRRQIYSDLLKEYRSTEMGVAVKKLFDFIDSCEERHIKIVDEYLRIFHDDEEKGLSSQQWQGTLHFSRRKVTQFYQQVAALNFIWFRRRILYTLSSGDIKLVPAILALDLIAMPYILVKITGEKLKKVLPEEMLPSNEKVKKKVPPKKEEIDKFHYKKLKLINRLLKKGDITVSKQKFDNMFKGVINKIIEREKEMKDEDGEE